MSSRFLLGIGLAFLLVFVAGIAAVVGITAVTDRPIVTDDSSVDKTPGKPVVAQFVPVAPVPSSAEITTVMPDSVLDSDLAGLADAVKLNQLSAGVGKEVWAQQIPVAQKLLEGSCDCDQRNWLKHFIQTGQFAMTGSNQYMKSVRLLAKLRRSNADLASSQAHR